jgi:23S rRNA (uracil1939-C5)-methyltransferase
MTRIVSLAARGDGVGEDGSFHANTAPGDVILPDGRVEVGPHRVKPLCRHFGTCGGCQLQHVDDAAYADFLIERIKGALAAQGLSAPPFGVPQISPPKSRRRVSLAAERKGKMVRIGFNEAGSHNLLDLAECPVMHPKLFALIGPLRGVLGSLLPERRRANVRMTLSDQGIDLLLSGIEVEGLAATESVTAFAGKHRIARLSLDEGYGATTRWEPEPVTITLGGMPVALPEGSFLQATKEGEQALVAAVRAIVGSSATVIDLFCGLGTFAFSLNASVHAIEGARDAVLAFQGAANRAGRAVSSEHRDLFRRPVTSQELGRFDAVILDPPRAGAKEQILEIATSGVPCIAYVSCNPSTFARDAKVLIDAGYRLENIEPVGQFRWSTHVELAASFRL